MGGTLCRYYIATLIILISSSSLLAQMDIEAKLFIKPEKPQRGELLTYRYVVTNKGTVDIPKKPVLGSFVMKRDGRRVYGRGIPLRKPLPPGETIEIPWETVHERFGGKFIGGKYTLCLKVAKYKEEADISNNEHTIEFDIEPEDRSGTDIEAKLFVKPEKPSLGELLTYKYVITNKGTTDIPKKPVLATFVAKRDGRRFYGQGIKSPTPLKPGETIEIPWKTVKETQGGKLIGGDYTLELEVSQFKGESDTENNKETIKFHIEPEDRSGTDIKAELFIKSESPKRGEQLTYRYVITNSGDTVIPKKPVLATFTAKRDGRRFYGRGVPLRKPLQPGETIEIPWHEVSKNLGGTFIGGDYSLELEVSQFKGERNTENNKQVIKFRIEPEDRSGTDIKAELHIKPENPKRGDQLTYRYVITNSGDTEIPKKQVLGTFTAKRDGRRVYGQGIPLRKPLAPGDKLEIPWKTVHERHGGLYIGGDYSLELEVSQFKGESNTENNKQVIKFHIEPEDRSGTDIEAKLFLKADTQKVGDLLTYRFVITNTGTTIIPKKPVLGTFEAKREGRRFYGQGIPLRKPLAPGGIIEIPWKTVSERLGGKLTPGKYSLELKVSSFKGEENRENNEQILQLELRE